MHFYVTAGKGSNTNSVKVVSGKTGMKNKMTYIAHQRKTARTFHIVREDITGIFSLFFKILN